ncbi:tRNA lysidine(34) synthetase TilS [Cellulomonas sp.]|uniref:tRNA lysidine(34) synthetase TilS n=1 Tax=Cellulomonas sp. TaxID=40001 RepID=UPI003BAB23FE
MSGPAREVAAVRSAVVASLADLPPGALVLVACSGGPDSLALAAGVAFVAGRPTTTWRAQAVVVDHGLQDGSAQVADEAAQACRGLGLDAVVVRVAVDGPGEAPARTARYAALERAADELGAATVLLGHTLDDQAETVLLGLARGSGARTLAGMPATRGRFRRPLLGMRRADTLAACAAQHLMPWHDPTNDGTHADASLRSRVRSDALPTLERVLGPGVAEALARTAVQLRDDADLLDALAADLLSAASVDGCLDVDALGAAAPALRTRALRTAAIAAGSPAGALLRVHVLAVDALVTDWHGQGAVDLPGGVAARRSCGRLALGPAPAPREAPVRAVDQEE